MNYSILREFDVANGPGIRVSLFVSGCHHHCKGCFNAETWDFNYGQPFTEDTIDTILQYMKPDYIAGITLLGGDPLEPLNQKGLLPLLRLLKESYPNKSIWCYTGYLYDKDLVPMSNESTITKEFLSFLDVLVDGPFIEEQKNLSLRFRGSANQRIIQMPQTLSQGKIVMVQ